MARIPMVTRTIKSTKAQVLGVNLETKATEVKEVILPRTYKDDSEVLNAISITGFKPVMVESKEVQEELYGMEESEFITVAKVQPVRVKKN
jgi:hypothetical protein